MLPPDLDLTLSLAPHAPVLVVMEHTASALWSQTFAATGFVVAVDDRVWRLNAHAAPHLANWWSRLHVVSPDATVLQHFDRHARVLPASYDSLQASLAMSYHLLRQEGHSSVGSLPWQGIPLTAIPDDVFTTVLTLHTATKALYKGDGPLKKYLLYANDWLQARQLLDLQTSRGYHLPDVMASFRSDADGLLHANWTLPVVPGRITTSLPPLHGLPHARRNALEARTGSRWVLVTWPEVVSVLASLTAYKKPRKTESGDDWILGRHDVAPPADSMLMNLFALDDLKQDWLATGQSYPIPTPVEPGVTYTVGKRALEAVAAFTVAQLSLLHQSMLRREPALTGFSDVMPYLGSIAFQIDDRVPLKFVRAYFDHLHAFHVAPVITIGQTRGAMYPLEDALTPVALDLDKPTVWPVVCPECGGRADCERDLIQHYKEDHPEVAVP